MPKSVRKIRIKSRKTKKSVRKTKKSVRKTFKTPRKMSKEYCKKTPCKKMGFSQKASCRPYKNCYKN